MPVTLLPSISKDVDQAKGELGASNLAAIVPLPIWYTPPTQQNDSPSAADKLQHLGDILGTDTFCSDELALQHTTMLFMASKSANSGASA